MKRLLILLPSLLGACAIPQQGINEIASTPAMVAYCASGRYHSLAEMTAKAQGYCSAHGKNARLSRSEPQGCGPSVSYFAGYYDCL